MNLSSEWYNNDVDRYIQTLMNTFFIIWSVIVQFILPEKSAYQYFRNWPVEELVYMQQNQQYHLYNFRREQEICI